MKEALKNWANGKQPDLVRIFQLARYELLNRYAHIVGKLSPSRRKFVASLQGKKHLNLHIASGGAKRDGWISMDVSPAADIRMDLRERFPVEDGSVKFLFCEHFCDHLNYPNMIGRFLHECHRVLEPCGRARFVMHDARDLARAYAENDTRYFDIAGLEGGLSDTEAVNLLFRFNDFHQFLYDFETFQSLLLSAGFSQVVRCEFLKSECQELVLDIDLPSREMLSMYIEAIK